MSWKIALKFIAPYASGVFSVFAFMLIYTKLFAVICGVLGLSSLFGYLGKELQK